MYYATVNGFTEVFSDYNAAINFLMYHKGRRSLRFVPTYQFIKGIA